LAVAPPGPAPVGGGGRARLSRETRSGANPSARYPRRHAVADVDPVPPNPARGPGRCGRAEPLAARARRLHPADRAGRLLLPAARLAGGGARATPSSPRGGAPRG